jgi:threonine synthase
MTPTTYTWSLACSSCSATAEAEGLPTVCPDCGAPWLVRYADLPDPAVKAKLAQRPWSMWRYREWLPLRESEEPVTLGEGFTPLLEAPRLGDALGLPTLWIKDESKNPTGSFKARGLSAAVTRATLAGATGFTVPTAGNAGVATSAYGRRAGLPVRVFAPRTTPPRILDQIRVFGAELELLDGHIGDCGKAARAHAAAHGAFDVSTLREPYRIEGKKTLGLEIAEQLGWKLPDVVLYPTGGGTGLIPETIASGLRVPAPLGGPVILRALAETGGRAVAVSDAALAASERRMAELEGVDACPEGGATLAALEALLAEGHVGRDESVVLFNTGAGWLYRRN